MELKIQSRNMEINGQVRDHINKKLGHIHRHLPNITMAVVELTSEPTKAQEDQVVVEVTLDVNGSILRAEQRAPNTTMAINSVTQVLDRRIERYKSRAYRSERTRQSTPLRAQQAEEVAQAPSPTPTEEDQTLGDGELVRVKRFEMEPMTVEDAVFQMELVGHSFYMFLNRDTNQYNVLYQRQDGNYGLIQPANR